MTPEEIKSIIHSIDPAAPEVRRLIAQAYGHRCQYCDEKESTSVDHIIATQRGGENSLFNVTMSCKRCNMKKGGRRLPNLYEGILLSLAESKAPQIAKKVLSWNGRKDLTHSDKSTICERLSLGHNVADISFDLYLNYPCAYRYALTVANAKKAVRAGKWVLRA